MEQGRISTIPDYRPDIDGLRAISIMSVVCFHAFPEWVKGGFIGVDVFFVISGYLISKIIFGALEKDTFNFIEFYARRVRRIFPALITVLASCFALGWFALLPDEFKQLGKHLFGAATFTSNFILLRESGYFDNVAATKPLLHLWSLGVEEQFYIFYPIILWASSRRRLNLLTVTLLIGGISFWLNISAHKITPVTDFYSPQTRFWELMLGSILSYLTLYKSVHIENLRLTIQNGLLAVIYANPEKSDDHLLSNVCSICGTALFLFCFFNTTKETPFPGWWAMLPTGGAVLLISAGPKTWINSKILSNRFFVWIGLISFPLYLWHWPILSFLAIIKGGTPHLSFRISAVIISIMLAWITYKLIERPVQSFRGSPIAAIFSIFIMATIGFVGLNIYHRDGLPFRMKDREAFADYFDNTLPGLRYDTRNNYAKWYLSDCDFFRVDDWRKGAAVNTPKDEIAKYCYIKNPSKKYNVMLWGDSHAQQLYYGLFQNLPKDWGILVGASAGCNPSIVPQDSTVNYCIRSNWFALQTAIREKPDVVIVAQRFGHNFENMKAVAQRLEAAGVKRIIFTGPTPEWDSDLPKIIVRDWWLHTPKRTFDHIDKTIIDQDLSLKAQFDKEKIGDFVDLVNFFCNSDGCLTYLGDDRMSGIVTADYGHLTLLASDYLAKNLLVGEIIRPIN